MAATKFGDSGGCSSVQLSTSVSASLWWSGTQLRPKIRQIEFATLAPKVDLRATCSNVAPQWRKPATAITSDLRSFASYRNRDTTIIYLAVSTPQWFFHCRCLTNVPALRSLTSQSLSHPHFIRYNGPSVIHSLIFRFVPMDLPLRSYFFSPLSIRIDNSKYFRLLCILIISYIFRIARSRSAPECFQR